MLGGENRELTLLFCDIRSFTSISESMEPTELTVFLNNFLTPMTDVLMRQRRHHRQVHGRRHHGVLECADRHARPPPARLRERTGDAGGAGRAQRGAASSRCAIGIGLNTGVCCVGNLGSRQRFDYSAIGDSVNVGSRIEGLTKFYGLSNLVADSTAREVEGWRCSKSIG